MPTIIPVLVDLDAAEFGANVPVDPGGEVMVLLETGGEPLLLPEPEVSLESEGVPELEVAVGEPEAEPRAAFALVPVV